VKGAQDVVKWTMRSDGGIHFEATVDLDGSQDFWARERVRRHLYSSRPAPAEPGRGGPLPFPAGRELGTLEQRLSRERGEAVPGRRSHPEYATPECDSIEDLVAHDKAGERILEGLIASAESRLSEEGIRG